MRLKLESIRADVEEFGGKAYRMGKANKDDAVVALLKDQLDEFKQVLRTLQKMAQAFCNTYAALVVSLELNTINFL